MRMTTVHLAFAATMLAPTVHAEISAAESLTDVEVFEYYVFNQSAGAFLRNLERDTNLRFQISPNVSGQLKNLSLIGHTDEVMDAVTGNLGLEWYAFNDVIHVSAKSEAGTRVVRLGDLSAVQAVAGLVDSGLPMGKFPAQITGEGAALALSGPPSFLALAEAVIETMPEVRQVAAVVPLGQSIVIRRGVQVQTTFLNAQDVAAEIPAKQEE